MGRRKPDSVMVAYVLPGGRTVQGQTRHADRRTAKQRIDGMQHNVGLKAAYRICVYPKRRK